MQYPGTYAENSAEMERIMSFSSEVKEELSRQASSSRHCQLAELAALLCFLGRLEADAQGEPVLCLQTENEAVIRKCFTLLEKTFKIEGGGYNIAQQPNILKYYGKQIPKILQAVKYSADEEFVNPLLIKSICCKRSFLRGVFLSTGSISNPQKGYHLEFVCDTMRQAQQLMEALMVFGIEAKVVQRKRYQVVYLKESEGIVELLNVMGAHISLMNLENLRILKDMRNTINRRVNCEAANITKTVNAATKQIDDILYIKEHYGFDNLSEPIRQMAQTRLDYPDATLKELGTLLLPPVGKSGVNHRLRKLSELADRIRGEKGRNCYGKENENQL